MKITKYNFLHYIEAGDSNYSLFPGQNMGEKFFLELESETWHKHSGWGNKKLYISTFFCMLVKFFIKLAPIFVTFKVSSTVRTLFLFLCCFCCDVGLAFFCWVKFAVHQINPIKDGNG